MSKLILEPEEEAFVLENQWDTAIPISFTYTPEEGTVLHAFPQVADVARSFLARYADCPTDDRALSFLFAEIAPYFEKWGYTDDRFRDRWGYILHPQQLLPTGSVPVVLLQADDEERNKTTYDLSASLSLGCIGYGVVEDGQIVSLSLTHEAPEIGDSVIEVGVETVPVARKKGYATACLAALSAHLAGLGIRAEYRCQRYNTASRRTAQAAGFSVVGRYYYYVGRRKHGI